MQRKNGEIERSIILEKMNNGSLSTKDALRQIDETFERQNKNLPFEEITAKQLQDAGFKVSRVAGEFNIEGKKFAARTPFVCKNWRI